MKEKAKKLMHLNDLVNEEPGRRVRRIIVEDDPEDEGNLDEVKCWWIPS